MHTRVSQAAMTAQTSVSLRIRPSKRDEIPMAAKDRRRVVMLAITPTQKQNKTQKSRYYAFVPSTFFCASGRSRLSVTMQTVHMHPPPYTAPFAQALTSKEG